MGLVAAAVAGRVHVLASAQSGRVTAEMRPRLSAVVMIARRSAGDIAPTAASALGSQTHR
jgi:hypothetical protein